MGRKTSRVGQQGATCCGDHRRSTRRALAVDTLMWNQILTSNDFIRNLPRWETVCQVSLRLGHTTTTAATAAAGRDPQDPTPLRGGAPAIPGLWGTGRGPPPPKDQDSGSSPPTHPAEAHSRRSAQPAGGTPPRLSAVGTRCDQDPWLRPGWRRWVPGRGVRGGGGQSPPPPPPTAEAAWTWPATSPGLVGGRAPPAEREVGRLRLVWRPLCPPPTPSAGGLREPTRPGASRRSLLLVSHRHMQRSQAGGLGSSCRPPRRGGAGRGGGGSWGPHCLPEAAPAPVAVGGQRGPCGGSRPPVAGTFLLPLPPHPPSSFVRATVPPLPRLAGARSSAPPPHSSPCAPNASW